MRIQNKLQIAFISTSIIVAASVLSISYFSMVRHFEQQEGNQLKSNAGHSAKVIDNFMFNRVADFNVLSNNPLFSRSSNEIISQYLLRVVNQYPFYDHLLFVNKNGIVLSSSDQKFIGVNILQMEPDIEDEFIKTISGGPEDVFFSDISNEKDIPLDIELLSDVIDLKGNVVGALVGFINMQALNELIFDIDHQISDNENTYLLNSKGDVLISGNHEAVILQPHPDLLKNNLQQIIERGENSFHVYENSKDIKVISGYANLSEYGTDGVGNWSLLTTAPYNEVMKPIYQMMYKAFFAFLFILLVILVMVVLFSRTLSKPIVELKQAVTNFGINGKPINLKGSNKDEIGSLCDSFNAMTEDLHDLSEKRNSAEHKLIAAKERAEESKNYLDNIINSIGDPVFVKDEQSQFLLVNDAFCSFFKLSKANIIGKTLAENIPPEEMEIFFRLDKQVISTGIENVNEELVIINEMETHIVSTKKTRFVDSSGNKFLIGVIRDITERKNAAIELKESEEKFSKAFDSNVIGKAILNKEKTIIEVNEALANIVGFKRENMLGKTAVEIGLFNFDSQENLENENKLWRQFSENGYASNIELKYLMQSGRELFILISLQALQLHNEDHVLITVLDITEKKNVEEELDQHRNNLEEVVVLRTAELEKEKVKAQSADLMKSAFLATMSHELRTPMNSIIGFTGILLKGFAGPLNKEQKKQLSMVKTSGHNLLGLINDVLDISKIEAGKLKVSLYPFNYLTTLEKTIDFLLPQASKKGLIINSEISELEITLNSDERRVEQVLLNLLSNAIKFSSKGTIEVKVSVVDNLLVTQVIDQGLGISKKDLNKLFMPFIQLEGGLSRAHEGTGLGLAICKSLIEKLGGTIQVKSKKGEGSNFIFTLPIDHIDNN